MALGNILREAREARGLSSTDVAEHTNMMVQIVEELEKEDFHRIAAPIYGRGFLKLYAELLDIDVQPLIDEFMDIFTGKVVPNVNRKESVVEEVKKPVPIALPEEEEPELQEVPVPQRVPIVPNQAVRSIEGAPSPLTQQDVKPAPQALESELPADQEQASVDVPEKESQPLVTTPVVDVEEKPVSQVEAPAELPPGDIPPEAGDDLFGADEPNLFNTSPLHERIAEAKRMMDEKSGAAKSGESDKKTSLHLSTNQRLPVFQISGRMDKIYETQSKSGGSSRRRGRSSGSVFRSIGDALGRLNHKLPFNLNAGGKNTFVYGSLGLILLVFLVSGMIVIYKLTQPSGVEKTDAGSQSVVEQKGVKPTPVKVPENPGDIPPPPDMYFD